MPAMPPQHSTNCVKVKPISIPLPGLPINWRAHEITAETLGGCLHGFFGHAIHLSGANGGLQPLEIEIVRPGGRFLPGRRNGWNDLSGDLRRQTVCRHAARCSE